jgi:hypothetical protein
MEGHSGALTGSDAGPAVAPSDVHLADPALAASAGGGAGTAATTAAAPGAAGGLPSSPPSSLGSAPLPSGGHSGASSHFPDGHLHRTQLAVSAGFPGDVPGGSDPRQPTGTASSGSSQQASLGAPGQQMGSAPGPAYDASTGAYAIPNGGGMYAPPMQQQGMYSHPGKQGGRSGGGRLYRGACSPLTAAVCLAGCLAGCPAVLLLLCCCWLHADTAEPPSNRVVVLTPLFGRR